MTAPASAWVVPEERYDFGRGHPMAPGRVHNTILLAEALGVLEHFDHLAATPLDEDLLCRIHSCDYVAAVRSGEQHPECGLGTTDNPVMPGMDQIARNVAAGTVAAARQVWQHGYRRAVNIAGGLHHAMPEASSGFCVYNDVACGIQWLLDAGCERIAYLDVDAHHGDGVQQIFFDDPRVLTISIHENPLDLFPGTGFPTETGGPGAIGSAVNCALPRGTTDAEWLRAFDAVVPEALRAFAPQVLVSQQGCDSHRDDPLTDLALTVDGQRASYLMMRELADELAAGWVAVGGGGYAVRSVVPRAWTCLLAVIGGVGLDGQTPIPDAVRAELTSLPERLGDLDEPLVWASVRDGWDPASRVDQAILATRRAVFPDLGLDPEF